MPHYRDWEGLLFTVNQMGGEGIVGKRKGVYINQALGAMTG